MYNPVLILIACVSLYLYVKSKSENSRIKYYFKTTVFYVYLFFLCLFAWPFLLPRWRCPENTRAIGPYARFLLKILGFKYEIRNGERLSGDHAAVVVSNHQFASDMLGVFHLWKHAGKIVLSSKKEILYILPVGFTAYLMGTAFLNRAKPAEAYKELQLVAEELKRNKTKIWLFPEGTRNKEPEFLKFKKGAFNMAVDAQVPIIPVVIAPMYFTDHRIYKFDSGLVIMQCLEEIPTTGLTREDVPALADTVRNKMIEVYEDLRREVLPDSKAEKLQ